MSNEAKLNDVRQQLKELENNLVADNPDLPNFLSMIRKDLSQHPELVYLLQPEEISPLYQGILLLSDQLKVQRAARPRTKASTTSSGVAAADLL